MNGPDVVWYGDDSESLTHRVVPFIASAVQDHGAALVIASTDHERAFRAALEGLGVDLQSAAMRDRLVFLNVNEVIKGLLVDGEIDRARYVRLVVNPIKKLGERYIVHVYGELAGILGSMRRLDAVGRLQGLTRELLSDVPVRLLDGYPSDGFEQELDSA